MAAPHLQLNPNNCSEIGLLILDYIKIYQITLTAMAGRVGISRAALRVICQKDGSPGKKTILKLAQVLGRSERELCWLVVENKLRTEFEEDVELYALILDLLKSYVKLIEKRLEILPRDRQVETYDLYEHALKVVSSIPLKK